MVKALTFAIFCSIIINVVEKENTFINFNKISLEEGVDSYICLM